MLEAAGASTELRRELFDLAGAPACEDRAALSFSYLEIRLMIHNAKALSAGEHESATLIRLAKGLFHLDEVESIALQDIQQRRDAINARQDLTAAQKNRQIRQIEEVEVRLAYRVGLKDRLALPGQPEGGRFIQMAGVTPDMLEAAATRVLALDDSPGSYRRWSVGISGSSTSSNSTGHRSRRSLTHSSPTNSSWMRRARPETWRRLTMSINPRRWACSTRSRKRN
ncbi:NEL-type E3 ubiquitin ligase domain-containing protein [Pseudomonas sp. NA13]